MEPDKLAAILRERISESGEKPAYILYSEELAIGRKHNLLRVQQPEDQGDGTIITKAIFEGTTFICVTVSEKVECYEALFGLHSLLDGARPRNRFDHDVVVAGFIYSEGLALVARRALSKSTAPGQLHLPGGHVEVEEYLADALRREIEEEFGVQVHAGELLHVFEYVENQHHTIGIVYAAHLEGPRTALRPDPLDNSEILWLGREELDPLFPDKTNHNYLAAVEGFAYMRRLLLRG